MRCTSYAPKGRTYRAARSVVHNIGPPTRLGDAVKETNCSRREFLGMSAAAAGASLAAHSMVPLPRNLIPAAVATSDRVRFGMVGVGMQGNWLLSESIKLPGVECAAACDLYDGRHTLAREIVRADLPVTRRYQTLLEDKNIDCIVAAVPPPLHKQAGGGRRRGVLGPDRRSAPAAPRDRRGGPPRHAPLSAPPRGKKHRLHGRGGPRSLAKAGGGGRGERRKEHLLQKADDREPPRR